MIVKMVDKEKIPKTFHSCICLFSKHCVWILYQTLGMYQHDKSGPYSRVMLVKKTLNEYVIYNIKNFIKEISRVPWRAMKGVR